MRKYIFMMTGLLLTQGLFAQQVETVETADAGLLWSPYFYVAVIAGVVLALAFQLLLTTFTGAAGLTGAKALTEKKQEPHGGKSTSDASRDSNKRDGEKEEGVDDKVYSALRKVNTGFGLMTLITASIALFAAAFVAVELTGSLNLIFGALTGLVIWGISYLITFSLQMMASTSMAGALAGVAKDSMKSLSDAASSIFGKSDSKRDTEHATAITQAVKDEMFGNMDLRKQISKYIQELKPDFGPRDFRKELETLLNEVEIEKFMSSDGGPGGIPEIIEEIKTGSSAMTQEKAKSAVSRLKSVIGSAKEEAASGKGRSDQVTDAALRALGMSREEAEANRHKVEEYLRSTGKDELSPEGIKRDIEKMFSDPKGGAESLGARLSAIDRNTITTVLESRTDMSHEEAQHRVDQVWGVFDKITGTFHQIKDQVRGQAQGQVEGAQAEMQAETASMKERTLDRLESYIASLDRPSTLDPEAIRHDVELLFHDPKAGADDLIRRAKMLNREDLMAIVSSNRHISREDAERTADRIEEIRDQAVEKAQEMKQEIERRVEQARQEAWHQADQMRKTFASAAWWLFTTAAVSGLAAAAGGWLAALI